MQKIILKTNPNNSLGGMAKRTRDQLIYSERECANPTTEIDIERVNIRLRKLLFYILLDYEILGDAIKDKTK